MKDAGQPVRRVTALPRLVCPSFEEDDVPRAGKFYPVRFLNDQNGARRVTRAALVYH